jgi:hypothetical protein
VNVALSIVFLTVLSYAAGAWAGRPWLVPVLNALAGYPFMVAPVVAGRLRRAAARMLLWALTMGVCATAMAYARPAQTSKLFLNAAAYEREMFEWVDTGRGREARPREFLPQHALHAAAFSALSLATGSALSMPFGAALMNYMGHYAGALGARRRSPLVALAAWNPWSIVRVISFVLLGVVLAGPLLCLVRGRRWRWSGEAGGLLAVALAGLVADAAIKAGFADVWRRLLTSLVRL